jgi:hypothetical protein
VAIGNAGLPTVTATVLDNNSIQNSSQTRQDGTKTELDNAKNNSLTYGVGLDWTVLTECACCQTRSVKGITKLGKRN